MTDDLLIAELCEAAYDIIDTEGWWDGKAPYHGREDGSCLVQALVHACKDKNVRDVRTVGTTFAVVRNYAGTYNLPAWNDSHGEQAVLDLLEKVADDYRNR